VSITSSGSTVSNSIRERFEGNNAPLNGGSGGLGTIGHAEFAQQAIDVGFDGGFGDVEEGGNLLVAAAVHDLLKDIEFTRGQFFGAHSLGEALRNRRRYVRFACVNGADGRYEVFGCHALEQVCPGAGLQGAIDVFVAVIGGENDETCLRSFHANALDDLNAGEPRHAEVDKGDVGLMFAELGDGFYAVGCFADNLDAVDDVEQGYESLAYYVVIIDDENANAFFGCHYDSIPLIARVFASLGVVTCRCTVVPVPSSLVTSRVPPMRSLRSRMPVRP
jgi:hypothetical protein